MIEHAAHEGRVVGRLQPPAVDQFTGARVGTVRQFERLLP
jgi:hypothetical protein